MHIAVAVLLEPVCERQGANPHGAADVEHVANRAAEAGFNRGVDAVAHALLGGLGGELLLLLPHPQRHRIGGLLGFAGGLPAEVALLVGVKTGAVVGG